MIPLFEQFRNSLHRNVNEKNTNAIELTSLSGNDLSQAQNQINDSWPNGLTYRGEEFFDKIYMDILYNFAGRELRIGETIEDDFGNYGTFNDDDPEDSFDPNEEITGQECYLGYIPEDDVFICGWDMFSGDENIVFVKLDRSLRPTKINSSKYLNAFSGGLFYNQKYGGYDLVKKQIPNRVDLRLD